MTALALDRHVYAPDCTTGLCMVDTAQLFTIEQPWRNNEKGASCVPEGTYDLIPYDSPTHGPTWYLSNAELGVGGPEAERSFCELHAANFARQLAGCIAFGLGAAPMFDPATGVVEAAVESSRQAITELLALLGPMSAGHTLTIRSTTGVPAP